MAGVKTITEQIYNNIYELIATGDFEPGARLTMKVLQEELGVSSSPIREALTRLQQDGIVDYQPNSGMSVRTYTSKDISNLFHMMADLDRLALIYALENDKELTFLDKLQKNIKISDLYLHDPNYKEWWSLSDKFHTTIADAADNPFLTDSLQRIYKHITIFSVKYEKSEDNRERIQKDHELVLSLLEQRKFDEAIDTYYKHVLSSMDQANLSL